MELLLLSLVTMWSHRFLIPSDCVCDISAISCLKYFQFMAWSFLHDPQFNFLSCLLSLLCCILHLFRSSAFCLWPLSSLSFPSLSDLNKCHVLKSYLSTSKSYILTSSLFYPEPSHNPIHSAYLTSLRRLGISQTKYVHKQMLDSFPQVYSFPCHKEY
jgi:hypothetical protein